MAPQGHRSEPRPLSRWHRRLRHGCLGEAASGWDRTGDRGRTGLAGLEHRPRGGDGAMVLECRSGRLRPGRLGRHPPVWRSAQSLRQRLLAAHGHRSRNGAQPGQHPQFSDWIHLGRIRRRAPVRWRAFGLGLHVPPHPRHRAWNRAGLHPGQRVHGRRQRRHSPFWRRTGRREHLLLARQGHGRRHRQLDRRAELRSRRLDSGS